MTHYKGKENMFHFTASVPVSDVNQIVNYIDAVGFLLTTIDDYQFEKFGISDVNSKIAIAGRLIQDLAEGVHLHFDKNAEERIKKEQENEQT